MQISLKIYPNTGNLIEEHLSYKRSLIEKGLENYQNDFYKDDNSAVSGLIIIR